MLVRVTVAGRVGIQAGARRTGEAGLGRLDRVNNEVDVSRRMDALNAAYEITANLVPVLPTAPGLSLLVCNSSGLAGIRNDGGPVGPIFDTNAWFCRAGRC